MFRFFSAPAIRPEPHVGARRATALKWPAAALVASAVALSLFDQPTPSAQSIGLVAAYNFNETSGTTVTDASGNANTGTIAGATRTPSGKFGGGAQFQRHQRASHRA